MLFRHQAQLASSLVLGWFSACVAWCCSCLPGPSLQPQVCVFSPHLVLALVLFCIACSAQVAFCLVWCIMLKLLIRRAVETFSLAEGVGKLCIFSRTVCLVLCSVMSFEINQI